MDKSICTKCAYSAVCLPGGFEQLFRALYDACLDTKGLLAMKKYDRLREKIPYMCASRGVRNVNFRQASIVAQRRRNVEKFNRRGTQTGRLPSNASNASNVVLYDD